MSKKSSARHRNTFRLPRRLWLVAAFVVLVAFVPSMNVRAATLSNAAVAISDSRPSQLAATYTMTVSGVSATPIRCIRATYVTTSGGSTAIAAPFSASAASIGGGSTLLNGSNGTWGVSNTQNVVTYTNATNTGAPATTSGATFIMNNINNGSTADTSYWVQFRTYSDSGCATPVDSASVGFIYTNGSTLTLTVDNSLSFSVNAVASGQSCNGATSTAASTATTIPFGTVTSASNGIICQDLTAATNATNGYTIYTRFTGQPTNALSQTIDNHTGTAGVPTTFSAAGTEAYGFTTNDATLSTGPGATNRYIANKWAAMAVTNAEVGYETAGVTSTTYRVGHQVGVSAITQPGTYTTTIIYTCTPVY